MGLPLKGNWEKWVGQNTAQEVRNGNDNVGSIDGKWGGKIKMVVYDN